MDSIHSGITRDDLCITTSQPDKNAKDEQTIEYQKFAWITMKKRITALVGKVNVSNVQFVADQILNENLYVGRGLFCQAVIESQLRFPELSNVYAALVAVINSKFPDVGLLLVKRVALKFKEAYDCKDKKRMQMTSKFLAHLVNQTVVYEYMAVSVLMYLLVNPSSDNVEVAGSFCKQCGSLLMDIVPHKLKEILEEFRRVLRKGALEKRVQVMIVKLFAAKRSNFEKYPSIVDELDVVEVEDQVTHAVSLLMDIHPENSCDSFKPITESDEFSQIMIPFDDFEDVFVDDEVSSRAPSD